MALKHTTKIMSYFRKDPKSKMLIFTGKKLVVRIPRRFETYGFMSIADTVQTIGIMSMEFDDTVSASLHLMGLIEMRPSDISNETINGLDYLVLTFYTGDPFLTSTDIVKNQAIIYAVYTEFIDRGKLIYTMGYEDLIWLFDSAKALCDASLPVDHAIFEVIYAHLTRLKDDRFTPYRQGPMNGDFAFIPLRAVSFAPDSTTARLMGSYFSDSTLAALLSDETHRKKFEDLLRGIPTEEAEARHAQENP